MNLLHGVTKKKILFSKFGRPNTGSGSGIEFIQNLDPDLMNLDPDPCIIKQTLIPTVLYDFLSLKNDVNKCLHF